MVEECEFQEAEFDIILLTAVLEHLYYPEKALQKLLKWLKPGGLIFIEVPSSDWLVNKIINFYYKLTFQDYVGNLSPMHPPYHLYEFSKKSFEIFAQNNNCEIADYKYYVCETFMPKILDPILIPLMQKTNTGMEIAIWLRKKE